MTYKNKVISSISFGPSIEGTENEEKNIIILFEDNTTRDIKYSQLNSIIKGLTNQKAEVETRLTEETSLRDECKRILGF